MVTITTDTGRFTGREIKAPLQWYKVECFEGESLEQLRNSSVSDNEIVVPKSRLLKS